MLRDPQEAPSQWQLKVLLSELGPGWLSEECTCGTFEPHENDTRIKQSQMATPLAHHPTLL